MANYNWDTLEDIYIRQTELTLKKGVVIEILMTCFKPIGTLNARILDSLFGSWTFPHDGKYVNPFKLLEFSSEDNWINAKVLFMKKNKEVDELKLFFQDVLHFLNSDHIKVERIEAKLS
ncbi:hypothetical protein [Paenibacillus contaminans]|uniref:Uncharacterized protein n=1 Tax=Paenibacillus contaminans TaxID=450362 RepID=A0A329M361_9BACL|nr:hypothetical protein [Paenibacillus contaminans]RAV13646.1 hypothetical protein DQG23_33175 [Paenibacillus contaminans]